MAEWVEQNRLKLNVDKTQMVLLSRKKKVKELENVVVKLKGQQVIWSGKIKYLGVWVYDGLKWKEHIEAVWRKCFAGLARLRRLRNTLPSAQRGTSTTPWYFYLIWTTAVSVDGLWRNHCSREQLRGSKTME